MTEQAGGPRIAVVLGTRAQLIKTAPIMRLLQEGRIPYRFIFTGQHRETVDELRRELGVKEPDCVVLEASREARTLGRFGGWLLTSTARLLFARRRILPFRDGIVLTHGDTASTVWGALLGRLTGNRVMHLESGLRSFNLVQPFPEEINRLATFALSDVYVCPGERALANLLRFGGEKIDTRHNTLYDAVRLALQGPTPRGAAIPSRDYAVASIHRFENVYRRRRLEWITDMLLEAAESMRLVFIVHPVTQGRLRRYGLASRLEAHPEVELRPRLGFVAFQRLLARSELVITDGGSNQEELAYLGKPTLLLRQVTERPEGLGSNAVLSGFDEATVLDFLENHGRYSRPPMEIEESPSRIVVDWLRANGFAGGPDV